MTFEWLALVLAVLLAPVAAMLEDMQPMDPYSSSCAGVVSATYGFGGAKCLALQSWKRAPCMCKLPAYIETVVGCMDAQMKNVSEPARNNTRTMAYQMFLEMGCPDANLTMADLNAYHRNASSLPAYDSSVREHSPAPWPATHAFQISDAEAYNALKAYTLNNESEPRSKRFGAALNGYWAGILLLRFISVCMSKVFPTVRNSQSPKPPSRWLRRHVTMPALFGRASMSLARRGISVPTRAHSLAIFGYFVLVIVFTFAHLPMWTPNYTWVYDKRQAYTSYLGQRSGVLPLYMCPLLILFAGRNNFLQWLTNWPQDVFVLYHRWVGRLVVFEVLVHSIVYSVQRAAAGRYASMWSQGYWSWGIVGTAFAMVLVVHSIVFLRRCSYEFFLVLHIVSVSLFIVGTYYHLDLLAEPIGLKFIYAMVAVWAFDRAARLLRVVTSNPLGVANVTLHGNMLELVMDRPRSWQVQMRPGLHTFVHIMKPTLFLQSHPFTLLTSVDEPNKIKMFCGVRDGMTRRLARMALESPEGCQTRLLLDGPYGHSHDLSEFDECVFVAGGVGITAPFAYIQSILWKYPRGFQKITLLWAIRDEEPLKWFESELQFLSEYPRVDVQLYIGSGTSKNARRLDVTSTVHDCIAASKGPISVLCCGPNSMNSETRDAVTSGLELTTNFVEYFEESFSF